MPTVYFVYLNSFISFDSKYIKTIKMKHKCFRNSSDWDNFGTGDRLLIQNGATDNLISIPLTQEEADMTSDW